MTLSPHHDIDIDLLSSIRDHAEDLKVIHLYDADLFDASSIERLLADLEDLLDALTHHHHPQRRLAEVLTAERTG